MSVVCLEHASFVDDLASGEESPQLMSVCTCFDEYKGFSVAFDYKSPSDDEMADMIQVDARPGIPFQLAVKSSFHLEEVVAQLDIRDVSADVEEEAVLTRFYDTIAASEALTELRFYIFVQAANRIQSLPIQSLRDFLEDYYSSVSSLKMRMTGIQPYVWEKESFSHVFQGDFDNIILFQTTIDCDPSMVDLRDYLGFVQWRVENSLDVVSPSTYLDIDVEGLSQSALFSSPEMQRQFASAHFESLSD